MNELTPKEIEVVEQLGNLGWSNYDIADKILHTRMVKQRDLLAADVVTVLKQRTPEEPSEPVTWRNVWDVIKVKW